MNTKIIRVTESHIEEANYQVKEMYDGGSYDDPVTIACQEAFKDASISLCDTKEGCLICSSLDGTSFKRFLIATIVETQYDRMQKKPTVWDKIIAWENTGEMEPFTFTAILS